MTRTLYIVRHGNTFDQGDIVTRVGGRTDLPLSSSGQVQVAKLAEAFSEIPLKACFCSPLLRTRQTAEAICGGHNLRIQNAEFLREIDYGPDENRSEQEVINRIGQKAISDWEERTIVPQGWKVNPTQYVRDWQLFLSKITDQVTLIVTSNGVARFALDAIETHVENRKMRTGSVSRLSFNSGKWILDYWGKRPPLT